MPLTFAALKNEMAVVLGTGARSGDNIRTSFGRWINQACRRIAYAYDWDERRREQSVVTVATFSTGTVAFTEGSTAITFAGATLVAGMAGRKIALSLGSTYYRILSVNTVAGTAILTEEYREDTAAAATYVMFQDEYDLADTTHSVEAANLMAGSVYGPMLDYEQVDLDGYGYLGTFTRQPGAWSIVTSTTVGKPRIRFLSVPDDVYRVTFRTLAKWVDLSADGDLYTASLPEDVEELILDRALRWAPRVEGSRRVMTDLEVRKALALVYANHHKRRYRIGSRRSILSAYGRLGIVVSMAGIRT